VAVIGASTGQFGAVWAQADVRKVLGVIGADVIEGELPVGHAAEAFSPDGALVEERHRATLAELVGVLVARAGAREAQAA
jgi:chromate reductase